MTNFDLLDTVLPKEGRYCMFGKGRYIVQKFFDTREQLDAEVSKLVDNNFDAYFGCAKFGDANNREHGNAEYFHALWMDIDCGEAKAKPNDKGKIEGYIDQETGLRAVMEFCRSQKLPRPIIVDSGNGLHFYWILTEVVRRPQWEALSKRFRALAIEKGLIVDTSVFEASRVLRVPGTFNFKNSPPSPVAVISGEHDVTDYEVWKALIGAPDAEIPQDTSHLPRGMSPLQEALMENRIKRFSTIMLKSAGGSGCQQLLYCYQNQKDISYNLWRSALSIATHCVDREKAIHKISSDHPQYTEGETEVKAADIGGPHLCTTFETQNPGGCDGCPNKGRFKSPIMLGMDIAKAEEPDDDGDGSDTAVATPKLPTLPTPYFRGKHGGIYRLPPTTEDDPVLVYEHELHVVKRMSDPVQGEVVLFRLHLPKDGVREFTLPMTTVIAERELRPALAMHGLVSFSDQFKLIYTYITTCVKNIQVTNKAEIMRTQFGWVDNNTKMIIGDREITAQGSFYSPPSSTTKVEAEMMQPEGTLEKWKEIFNMYAQPGLEANAFAALTGFGSPLLKFTGLSGAIINLIFPGSGSGKSTILYMCNSIYGHPKNLASIWKDTLNAKMHRLGVLNNLPNTIDEITNTTAEEFSDLAYSISQGRGKNRMKASSNEMRVNLTSWQGITLASSNASFYEKLGAAKDSPDGESMRLMEYAIMPSSIIPVELGKKMFDHELMENYGHAGDIYAEYLVGHLEDVIDLLRQVQAKIDREVQFTSRERFWSGLAACNITGGLLAKDLGLHNYDMRAVYKWMVNMLQGMREDIKPPSSNVVTIIGEYVNNNMSNVLVVNGDADARTNLVALPTMEPRGELLIRFEPDTKRLFFTAKEFRGYCIKRQINYKGVLESLKETGVFIGPGNKRMSKGMKVYSPPVRILEFNTDHPDFVNVNDVLGADDDNRNGAVQN